MREEVIISERPPKEGGAMSPELERAVAVAEKAYRDAIRPVYDQYVLAMRPSAAVVNAAKSAFRTELEAITAERTRAIKAAYSQETP